MRNFYNVIFHNIGEKAIWWTATEYDDYNAWMRSMDYNSNGFYRDGYLKERSSGNRKSGVEFNICFYDCFTEL